MNEDELIAIERQNLINYLQTLGFVCDNSYNDYFLLFDEFINSGSYENRIRLANANLEKSNGNLDYFLQLCRLYVS